MKRQYKKNNKNQGISLQQGPNIIFQPSQNSLFKKRSETKLHWQQHFLIGSLDFNWMAFSTEKLPGKSFVPASCNLMLSSTAALGVKNYNPFWSLPEDIFSDSSSYAGLCQLWGGALSNANCLSAAKVLFQMANSLVSITSQSTNIRLVPTGKDALQERLWFAPQKWIICGCSLQTCLTCNLCFLIYSLTLYSIWKCTPHKGWMILVVVTLNDSEDVRNGSKTSGDKWYKILLFLPTWWSPLD